MVDTSVQNAVVYDKFQFERNGYFSVDPDSKPGQVCILSFLLVSELYYDKKTSKFIKLCKGDMSRRPKTAKISLGLTDWYLVQGFIRL